MTNQARDVRKLSATDSGPDGARAARPAEPDGAPSLDAHAPYPPFIDSEPSIVRDVAASCDAPEARIATAIEAARTLPDAAFEVVETLLALAREEGRERLAALASGLRATLATLPAAGDDPLAAVDDPMSTEELASSLLDAELETRHHRVEVLGQSVSAAEAARLVGRSRQAVERLRRQGRALALRVGSRWRYPRWQLDPDAPGGVVPGLGPVLAALGLSPAGAALWLTRPHPRLDDRPPIVLLRAGRADDVARLAEEAGRLP